MCPSKFRVFRFHDFFLRWFERWKGQWRLLPKTCTYYIVIRVTPISSNCYYDFSSPVSPRILFTSKDLGRSHRLVQQQQQVRQRQGGSNGIIVCVSRRASCASSTRTWSTCSSCWLHCQSTTEYSAVVVVLAAAENFFQAAPSHSTIVVCTAVPSSDHSDHNLLKWQEGVYTGYRPYTLYKPLYYRVENDIRNFEIPAILSCQVGNSDSSNFWSFTS